MTLNNEAAASDVERVVRLMLKHGFATGHADSMDEVLEELDVALSESLAPYYKLIYAVGNKYPGETRFETALRYIKTAECCDNGPAQNERPNQK